MSLRLLLREHPSRAFALVTDDQALVFRHSPYHNGGEVQTYRATPKPPPSKCMVEFSPLENIDLSDYRVLRPSGVHGTLGLINISTDLFLCVISGAVRVATVRPNETVQRILSVEFCQYLSLKKGASVRYAQDCLNSSDYDVEYQQEFDPYAPEPQITSGFENAHTGHGGEGQLEHPCQDLKKILSSGTFYYSVDFDLTNRLQHRSSEESAFDVDSLDDGYLWNQYMIDPLIKFRSRLATHEKELLDSCRILTSAIRGFVLTITIPQSTSPLKSSKNNLPSALTLISRLSCRRAGTRFNSRGIDDDGNAANFVETETIFWHSNGLCFSYAQIRGSVPLFWEQAAGLLPGQQKIQITRSEEATQPSFDKHFESLEVDYGVVHILNLLSETKPGEAELTARYKYHVQHSPWNLGLGGTSEYRLLDSQFDFHAETRGPGGYEAASMVKRLIQQRADSFGYFLCEEAASSHEKATRSGTLVILQQEGAFRTNCLDCLDRTNLIQTIISQMTLESFLQGRGHQASSDFWVRHSSLWADNGDALSKIYAGTGALKSSFTRHGKMSLAGALADVRKSATRLYINNFADKGRQNTIDMLLGHLVEQSPVYLYDPITDYVNAELKRRINEYSTSDVIHIWVGTFNLNGRGRGVNEDLTAWLWPKASSSQQYPDIVAVGFQEIVELSPQQIMSTDPERRRAWEIAVRMTLNENAKKHSAEEYVLLRTGQLVGAALMLFVKSTALKKIKNVEGSIKKTGMSGMAGNKGAVAIRMDYANTRICFVTAHLAAGFANYEERNRDYRTISHGLRFQRNRTIEDHDTIIWAGDFNYRIGLSDDKARRLIKAGDLDTLYQNDQLNLQMVAGQTFQYYSEARITFMPTYKYNNGTDDYDTSEKARIPAWCDRVLRKGDNLKQINYTTAPLRFSDHRAVYATFQCTVSAIDESKKADLSQEIYTKRRVDVGDTTANARNDDVDDEDLIGYDSIAPELPPASSDRRKWWLDNGLPARSDVQPPDERSIINERRPHNPFTPTSEPDWKVIAKHTTSQGGTTRTASNGKSEALVRDSRNEQRSTGAPRSRASSHASVQSSSSSIARKPAPPVPKKPTLLSRPSEGRPSQEARTTEDLDRLLLKARTSAEVKESDFAAQASYPPPPRRTAKAHTGPLQLDKNLGRQDSNGGAPLPTRPKANSQTSSGLMDEDDSGASAIPALQPQRPLQPQRRGGPNR